jgi:hypothetical protein
MLANNAASTAAGDEADGARAAGAAGGKSSSAGGWRRTGGRSPSSSSRSRSATWGRPGRDRRRSRSGRTGWLPTCGARRRRRGRRLAHRRGGCGPACRRKFALPDRRRSGSALQASYRAAARRCVRERRRRTAWFFLKGEGILSHSRGKPHRQAAAPRPDPDNQATQSSPQCCAHHAVPRDGVFPSLNPNSVLGVSRVH